MSSFGWAGLLSRPRRSSPCERVIMFSTERVCSVVRNLCSNLSIVEDYNTWKNGTKHTKTILLKSKTRSIIKPSPARSPPPPPHATPPTTSPGPTTGYACTPVVALPISSKNSSTDPRSRSSRECSITTPPSNTPAPAALTLTSDTLSAPFCPSAMTVS